MEVLCHRNHTRWIAVALVAIGLTGCSRYRPFERVARRQTALPPTRIVREQPRLEPEIPVTLPPAASYSGSRVASSYGPLAGVSVAPLGSTGFSRDIRHPQPHGPRPQPMPVTTPGNTTARRPATPRSEPSKDETPLSLPSGPKRNRNGTSLTEQSRESKETGQTQEQAAGIPGYTIVEANVATGGQPNLEGMKWLKERGFHTVFNLLPDSESDPAEASMVRELGLNYVSLPINAPSINRDTLDRFNQIVDDAQRRPLFIHDSTGSRTGAMWYLHRVTVDNIPEERARHQAARIGLKDSDTDLWLAIQRFLAERK